MTADSRRDVEPGSSPGPEGTSSPQIRPGMGTENSCALLAALVGAIRPVVVVEIGAGDSTVALAHALARARDAHESDRRTVESGRTGQRASLLRPQRVATTYDPRLVTVDDCSGEGSSAELAWAALEGFDDVVEVVRRDFFDLTDDELDDLGPIDLAWIDAGTPTDDARFLARLLPRVRPGGLVVMHEPMMTTPVRTSGGERLRQVRSPLWEELCWRLDDSCELLVIPETVKYRQSGIGVLRRRTDEEMRFRTESFEDEMLAISEAPVRFDALGVGAGRRERASQQALVNVMSDARARAVYGCICAGISSMTDIGTQLDMTSKDLAKVIARLVSAGLVDNRDGLRDDPTAWRQHARHGERSMRGLTTAPITDPDVLTVVARQFRAGRTYSEAEVSGICREFTDDFALLRRALVDAGLLARSDGRYWRIADG